MNVNFFRKCMINATDKKSFGLVLTAINEVRKRIYYILDNKFVFFYQPDFHIGALIGYKNITCQGFFFKDMENFYDMDFQDMEGLVRNV